MKKVNKLTEEDIKIHLIYMMDDIKRWIDEMGCLPIIEIKHDNQDCNWMNHIEDP